MATSNFTTETAGNDACYVSGTHLADAAMFIQSAMRLIEQADGEAWCLLEKAAAEINAAQDYLEELDPVAAPISGEILSMLKRVGRA